VLLYLKNLQSKQRFWVTFLETEVTVGVEEEYWRMGDMVVCF